jgi:uncharacterized protein YgiM (DUF1202 family)
MRRKKIAAILTVMMCLVAVTAGCEKKDDKASKEATEATEPATEISLQTADVEPAPLPEPIPEPEPEPLPAVSEDAAELVAEPAVDEFGIADIDEIKLYATEKVRMRTEPNTEGDNVSGMLNAGDEVTANGKSGEWHRIKKGDKVLYVKSEYLTDVKPEKKDDSEAANAEATTDTAAATAQAATDAAQQTAAAQQAAQQAAAQAATDAANKAAADAATKAAADAATKAATDAAAQAATQAAAAAAAAPAATGIPSWATPGDSGISAADCVTIYNFWKNNKGQDDATIQSYWGSLTNHYAGHGTSGW